MADASTLGKIRGRFDVENHSNFKNIVRKRVNSRQRIVIDRGESDAVSSSVPERFSETVSCEYLARRIVHCGGFDSGPNTLEGFPPCFQHCAGFKSELFWPSENVRVISVQKPP